MPRTKLNKSNIPEIDYTYASNDRWPWDCKNCNTNLEIYSTTLQHANYYADDTSHIVKCNRCGCVTRILS